MEKYLLMPENPPKGAKQEVWVSHSLTAANEQNLDQLGPLVLAYPQHCSKDTYTVFMLCFFVKHATALLSHEVNKCSIDFTVSGFSCNAKITWQNSSAYVLRQLRCKMILSCPRNPTSLYKFCFYLPNWELRRLDKIFNT